MRSAGDPLRKAEGMRWAQAVPDLIMAVLALATIAAIRADQTGNMLTVGLITLAFVIPVRPIRKFGTGHVSRYVHDETRVAFQRTATAIGFWTALAAAVAVSLFASCVAPISRLMRCTSSWRRQWPRCG